MPPVLKPLPKEKKQRQPLRTKSRLQSKKKPKRTYNPDPFPQSVKQEICQRQGGICAHPGCNNQIDEYHHICFKGMGGSKAPWRHDKRNGVGFCMMHHKPMIHYGNEATYWRRYWERQAVIEFGWLGGRELTLEEYENAAGFKISRG